MKTRIAYIGVYINNPKIDHERSTVEIIDIDLCHPVHEAIEKLRGIVLDGIICQTSGRSRYNFKEYYELCLMRLSETAMKEVYYES